mmetsp:Transcript_28292/g.78125  ORF Transcript_28292/g.78125 Transcript_28292/m.78125 type:complete len:424 (-) Transcript_28292:171-1442(-)
MQLIRIWSLILPWTPRALLACRSLKNENLFLFSSIWSWNFLARRSSAQSSAHFCTTKSRRPLSFAADMRSKTFFASSFLPFMCSFNFLSASFTASLSSLSLRMSSMCFCHDCQTKVMSPVWEPAFILNNAFLAFSLCSALKLSRRALASSICFAVSPPSLRDFTSFAQPRRTQARRPSPSSAHFLPNALRTFASWRSLYMYNLRSDSSNCVLNLSRILRVSFSFIVSPSHEEKTVRISALSFFDAKPISMPLFLSFDDSASLSSCASIAKTCWRACSASSEAAASRAMRLSVLSRQLKWPFRIFEAIVAACRIAFFNKCLQAVVSASISNLSCTACSSPASSAARNRMEVSSAFWSSLATSSKLSIMSSDIASTILMSMVSSSRSNKLSLFLNLQPFTSKTSRAVDKTQFRSLLLVIFEFTIR